MDLKMSIDWRYPWVGDIHGSENVNGLETSMDLKMSMDLRYPSIWEHNNNKGR
jgi:hypothetical protein